jgi:hypothetical protein
MPVERSPLAKQAQLLLLVPNSHLQQLLSQSYAPLMFQENNE